MGSVALDLMRGRDKGRSSASITPSVPSVARWISGSPLNLSLDEQPAEILATELWGSPLMRVIPICLLESRTASTPVTDGDYRVVVGTCGAFLPYLPHPAMSRSTLVRNFFWL